LGKQKIDYNNFIENNNNEIIKNYNVDKIIDEYYSIFEKYLKKGK